MRTAAKSDKNQAEIVSALRKLGYSVLILSRVGHGCPDLLVANGSKQVLAEVKSPGGKLTPDEIRFIAGWSADLIVVAYSAQDIISWFDAK